MNWIRKIFILCFFLLAHNAFGTIYLDINSSELKTLEIIINGERHLGDFFDFKSGEIDISPLDDLEVESFGDLVIRIDNDELPLSEKVRKRLLSFIKEPKIEKRNNIDCSKFCSYLYEIDSNLEEDDNFSISMIRNPDRLTNLGPGDIVAIAVSSNKECITRHYAVFLGSDKSLFLSKFGSYPGLGVTSLKSLIQLYTKEDEKIRLFKFTYNRNSKNSV